MISEISDLSRLCIHTITTKSWSLAESVRQYERAGIRGISVWREALNDLGLKQSAKILKESSLDVVSLVRGGFFPARTKAERNAAIDDNKLAIDQAAEIGAPLVVLVCGAVPGMPLEVARGQIRDGIEQVLLYAQDAEVELSIEPLHPMYADSRSAINTLSQANDIVEDIDSPWLGVTIDVYHLWWDPDLEREIERAGETIMSFHISDWCTPTRDILNDRALMGEGCIDIPKIRSWVEMAGFLGYDEVEIFSTEYWAEDQTKYLEKIKQAYLSHS